MKATQTSVCTFGTPTTTVPHVCAGCAAEADRLRAAFAAAVRAGTHDADGYTPAEAKHRPLKQRDLLRSL